MTDCIYTPDELVTVYKQAKNSREQITILADLCCTTKAEMRELLEDLGCDVPPARCGGRGRKVKPFDQEKALALWQAGKTDPEIAEAVGTYAQRIYLWRTANRLPARRGYRSR